MLDYVCGAVHGPPLTPTFPDRYSKRSRRDGVRTVASEEQMQTAFIDENGDVRTKIATHLLNDNLLMWAHPRSRLEKSGWQPHQLNKLASVQRLLATLQIMLVHQQLRAAQEAGDEARWNEILEKLDMDVQRWLCCEPWKAVWAGIVPGARVNEARVGYSPKVLAGAQMGVKEMLVDKVRKRALLLPAAPLINEHLRHRRRSSRDSAQKPLLPSCPPPTGARLSARSPSPPTTA